MSHQNCSQALEETSPLLQQFPHFLHLISAFLCLLLPAGGTRCFGASVIAPCAHRGVLSHLEIRTGASLNLECGSLSRLIYYSEASGILPPKRERDKVIGMFLSRNFFFLMRCTMSFVTCGAAHTLFPLLSPIPSQKNGEFPYAAINLLHKTHKTEGRNEGFIHSY